jgi:hypothetical protein
MAQSIPIIMLEERQIYQHHLIPPPLPSSSFSPIQIYTSPRNLPSTHSHAPPCASHSTVFIHSDFRDVPPASAFSPSFLCAPFVHLFGFSSGLSRGVYLPRVGSFHGLLLGKGFSKIFAGAKSVVLLLLLLPFPHHYHYRCCCCVYLLSCFCY